MSHSSNGYVPPRPAGEFDFFFLDPSRIFVFCFLYMSGSKSGYFGTREQVRDKMLSNVTYWVGILCIDMFSIILH